jgi:hypothetical protein
MQPNVADPLYMLRSGPMGWFTAQGCATRPRRRGERLPCEVAHITRRKGLPWLIARSHMSPMIYNGSIACAAGHEGLIFATCRRADRVPSATSQARRPPSASRPRHSSEERNEDDSHDGGAAAQHAAVNKVEELP